METNGVVEVELARIVIDETRPEQVVVLREKNGKRLLPIVIGASEAAAIKMQVSSVKPERPFTHDLLKDTIGGLSATLDRVVIDDLKQNTFYAKLYLKNEKKEPVVVDARPSDSIALALRMKSPIFVKEKIFTKIGKKQNDN